MYNKTVVYNELYSYSLTLHPTLRSSISKQSQQKMKTHDKDMIIKLHDLAREMNIKELREIADRFAELVRNKG